MPKSKCKILLVWTSFNVRMFMDEHICFQDLYSAFHMQGRCAQQCLREEFWIKALCLLDTVLNNLFSLS